MRLHLVLSETSRFTARVTGGLSPASAVTMLSLHTQAQATAASGTLGYDDLEIGQQVLALGTAPSRERQWFRAEVTSLQPAVMVKYVATHPEGNTLALLLPQPNKAKVYREDLAPLPP